MRRPPLATHVAIGLLVVAATAYSLLAWRAPGVGVDPDAWRLMLAGLDFRETGVYAPSRPPGFPVVELLSAAIAPLGPLAFKLLTAWAGAACVALTYSIVAHRSRRVAIAAAALLMPCPALVLASISTMDYVWSLAFMLLAFRFAQQRRSAVWAGVFIGVAAGCRITAVAALPVAWLLLWREARPPRRDSLRLAAAALGVTGLFYGWVLASTDDMVGASGGRFLPPTLDQLGRVPVALFGRIGAVAVGIAVLLAAAQSLRRKRGGPSVSARDGLTIGVMIIVFVAAYLAASYEALYLLPMVPALFVFLAARLGRLPVAALAAVLLIADYRDVSQYGLTYGAVVQDIRDRDRSARLTAWLLAHPPEPPALIIAGSRAPMLAYTARTQGPALPPGTRVDYLLRQWMVEAARRPGERLYCLKDMLGPCRERGYDPVAEGATIWWPPSVGPGL